MDTLLILIIIGVIIAAIMILVETGLLGLMINFFGLIYMHVRPQRHKAIVAAISILWASLIIALSGGIIVFFMPFGFLINPIGAIIGLIVGLLSGLVLMYVLRIFSGKPVVNRRDTYSPKIFNETEYEILRKKPTEVELDKMSQRASEDFDSHYALGEVYSHSPYYNWKRAEEEYEKCLKLDPSSIRAHLGIVDALKQQGRLSEADDHRREVIRLKALAHEPTDFDIYWLADSLEDQGKLEEAAVEYRKIFTNFDKEKHYVGWDNHGEGFVFRLLDKKSDNLIRTKEVKIER